MKKIVIVMRDDEGGPRVMVLERVDADEGEQVSKSMQHTREAIARVLTLMGREVIQARSRDDLVRVLGEQEDAISVIIVMQQAEADREGIKCLEAVRSKCGDRIAVIGIAESVEYMEELAARRVDALLGAPLGVPNLDAILERVKGYK